MRFLPVRHLWGVTEAWETAFPRFAREGFQAIEAPLQFFPAEDRARYQRLSREVGLDTVAMIFTEGATVDAHIASFRAQLAAALTVSPLFVNAHSGRDAWSREDAERFYREVRRIEADTPVVVAHETHRGRPMFSPWATRDLLLAVPGLRLTVDFSHWTCVAERLVLDDEPALLRLVADHAVHLHARVGYAQGPQVPDPRAPEFQPEVTAHERWWDVVWERMAARQVPQVSLTPEFGPAPYLHHLPHTNVPVADLDAICTWQMRRQRERFQQRYGQAASA